MISSLQLGGAERQIVGLAHALQLGGHDVELLSYSKGDFYADTLQNLGIKHVFIPKMNDTQLVEDIVSRVRENGTQLLISFLAGTNMKACVVSRRCPGLKLIVSERNCNRHMHFHDWLRFRYYSQADLVVCNNYSQESFIRTHFKELSSKLKTIPNFVDLKTFRPMEHKPSESRRIIVTARVCKRKNTLGLIQAAGKLASKGLKFRIDWYGLYAEDKYSTQCRKQIAGLGLDQTFFIHKAVHDLAPYYQDADIFCLPSFYEGTSNSLAEALACGKPVVCSRVSDNTRYAREGFNGFLFNPHDVDAIADALQHAIELPDNQLLEYGRNGRALVEKGLSPETFAARYLEIIDLI